VSTTRRHDHRPRPPIGLRVLAVPLVPANAVYDCLSRLPARLAAAVRAHPGVPAIVVATPRLYRHHLDRHILPGFGALRPSEAGVPRLDEFVTAVRTRSTSYVEPGSPRPEMPPSTHASWS
jgi:hypothetical protein